MGTHKVFILLVPIINMRRTGLKDILGDLEEPISEKQLKVEKDTELEKIVDGLLNTFEKISTGQLNPYIVDERVVYLASVEYLQKLNYDLTEKVIAELALRICAHNNLPKFESRAGQLITACITVSFEQSHNNFEICLTEPVHCLGANLRGMVDRNIILTVNNLAAPAGHISSSQQGWFTNARYLDVTITGAGNVAMHDDIMQYFSSRTYGVPIIGDGAKESVFRVDDKQLFEYLNGIKHWGENEVYLIDSGSTPDISAINSRQKTSEEFRVAMEA